MPRVPRRDRAPMFGGADDETVEDMALPPSLWNEEVRPNAPFASIDSNAGPW
jgi:hypothetical protein